MSRVLHLFLGDQDCSVGVFSRWLCGISSTRDLTRNFSRQSIAWINFIPSHSPEAGILLAGRFALLHALVMFWLVNYHFALKFWAKLFGFLCNGDDDSFLPLGGLYESRVKAGGIKTEPLLKSVGGEGLAGKPSILIILSSVPLCIPP
ncbi:hypothetical protein B0H13DRAFT_1886881 [Mycena leptocephala]|nr:hypothetical protein B0H13DRAFT_1886881 [Mycena leptocephala]